MLNNKQLIEKAIQMLKNSNNKVIITDVFITEATDHTPIVVLKNDNGILANYQILDNGELLKLDHD